MTFIILIHYMPEKSGNMHATLLIGDIGIVGEREHFSLLYIIFLHLKNLTLKIVSLNNSNYEKNEIKF